MRIYIYLKEKNKEHNFYYESILNTYFNIDKHTRSKFKNLPKKEEKEFFKGIIQKQTVERLIKEEIKRTKEVFKGRMNNEIIEYKLVTRVTGRYIEGSYFAHEYNKLVKGRGRRLVYDNGFIQYEIECLDKELSVLDGIWTEPDNNGCGDKFYPEKELK